MNAGQFDRRITLSRQGADLDDGLQTQPGAFVPYATVWAMLTPLSGTEKLAAAQLLGTNRLKFTIRRTDQVSDTDDKCQLTYLGTDYDITDISEDGRAYLVLGVVARADNA